MRSSVTTSILPPTSLVMAGRNLASEYLNEVILYGGIPTRRIDVIRDLEFHGWDQQSIGWYMLNAEALDTP
jgi:hypothetical protein